jgi:hypothetical protein
MASQFLVEFQIKQAARTKLEVDIQAFLERGGIIQRR